MKNIFNRLKQGLAKTHNSFTDKLKGIFLNTASRQEFSDALEEILVSSDVGVNTSLKILEKLKDKPKTTDIEEFKCYLKEVVLDIFKGSRMCSNAVVKAFEHKPFVIMMVGINGVGKTTTIGKLAKRFKKDGKKVMLAAGDTFRAAAVEQLDVWAKRVGCEIIKHVHGSDPAAVAFDAMKASNARGVDVLILDTEGRLHTKTNLMEELKKIKRVINREMPSAHHEILLVLDASTGQNALSQARLFNETIGVTGIVLTKLDGTAKGGIVVAIADELKIPIRYIGVGEDAEDLQEFSAEGFVEALI
ncbi:MAG: signal recognition particle-docking protein FtsY [Deltaproteobacteria bacterium]|nr:signal recognition particle-docking protein FtsY [Deltaproteobacteria bacterium]